MKKFTFGEKIKFLADKKKLSLRKIAKKARISYNTLTSLTSGRADIPRLVTVIKLARFFKISIDDLLKDVVFKIVT